MRSAAEAAPSRDQELCDRRRQLREEKTSITSRSTNKIIMILSDSTVATSTKSIIMRSANSSICRPEELLQLPHG